MIATLERHQGSFHGWLFQKAAVFRSEQGQNERISRAVLDCAKHAREIFSVHNCDPGRFERSVGWTGGNDASHSPHFTDCLVEIKTRSSDFVSRQPFLKAKRRAEITKLHPQMHAPSFTRAMKLAGEIGG